ncbi:MAG: hypothetical protein UV73_C0002G0142 [Candidatus Gottesmanbacteria bacterium GW2011_GWA2_43_14]|uniref:Uncharacterized protein n=1 Tax=Candidatus Gottesmanbacteria bacterium GW2011_GWA2_43_14 TaxID=1618443 RepID=A0A0G1GI12_9BACT|nr:MAG: hypothetical protein UV73_C0002G0142 [Candidatus Gottesmanbacteria bacterium GW2011_GWA2_43_14]
MKKEVIRFFNTNKRKFYLGLILVFGSFLRLYHLEYTLPVDPDAAMALLIAKKIVEENYVLLVGPLTSLSNFNILPPTYYYIISVLYFFFRNYLAIAYCFAIIGIISIYLIYKVGLILIGPKGALTAALVFSASHYMVRHARAVWEPHLVPFFILLAIYFLLLYEKQGKFLLFIISVSAFFVSLMYISSFLLIPGYFMLSFYVLSKKFQNKLLVLSALAVIFSVFFLMIYLPTIIYEINNNYPTWNNLKNYFRGNTIYFKPDFSLIISQIYKNSVLSFDLLKLFPNLLSVVFLFIYLVMHFLLTKRAILPPKIKYMLLLFLPGFFMTGFYQGQPAIHRLNALSLIIIILYAGIGGINRLNLKKYRLFSAISVFLLLGIYGQFLFFTIGEMKNIPWEKISYKDRSVFQTAEYILAKAGQSSFSISTSTPGEPKNYHTTRYIYALEKISGKNLSKMNKKGNWLSSRVQKNKDYIFLICQNYNAANVSTECLKYFLNMEKLPLFLSEKQIGRNIIYQIPGI